LISLKIKLLGRYSFYFTLVIVSLSKKFTFISQLNLDFGEENFPKKPHSRTFFKGNLILKLKKIKKLIKIFSLKFEYPNYKFFRRAAILQS